MRMVLFIFPISCLLYGMITAGTRHQIFYLLTNLRVQVLVTLLMILTFGMMKQALATTYMTSCRSFSRRILSLSRMIFILLENHMLEINYVLALASRVNQGNKRKQGIHINLKGFAVGNRLTNPAIQ
ncbi:Serine carboxypeptidase 3 [Glycine max]|nr:Serine carboxypeptidase 3 [Glycine max]KAH1220577.1 Serine carboxypeptidase 3 [Glycine max]